MTFTYDLKRDQFILENGIGISSAVLMELPLSLVQDSIYREHDYHVDREVLELMKMLLDMNMETNRLSWTVDERGYTPF